METHQHVQPEVELPPSHEERVVDVPRDDVGLFDQVGVEHGAGPRLPGPLLELRQLVDEEDARPLGLPAGLHDPGARRVLAVLLHEHVVV